MGSNATVEYLLERKKLLEQAIERKILEEERFGKDEDYAAGTVICADRKYGSKAYTYTFLKVMNGSWYSSSRVGQKVYTWSQLVDFLSDCESVHYVTQWTEL